MTNTIKQLCRRFKISRSTVLYYDSIGLIKPSTRTNKNYRLYSEEDISRFEQICLYRQLGIPLLEIKSILDTNDNEVSRILEKRLYDLDQEISKLRIQQKFIVNMLRNNKLLKNLHFLDRDVLVNSLSAAGFSELEMFKLHVELERMSPGAHQEFLESLGINDDEIKEIRYNAEELIKNKVLPMLEINIQ